MERLDTFVIALPDTDLPQVLVQRARRSAERTIEHASGRPWLLLRAGAEHILTFVHGPTKIVLIGPTSASASDLEQSARASRAASDLVRRVRRFHGAFTLFASIDGMLVASGPALETRRVFHATCLGFRIVTDRCDVLPRLVRRG